MLLLYSAQGGNRWHYIAETLLQDICGLYISFTHNREEFISYDGPKINYSAERITDKEIHITPSHLLFEDGIREQRIEVFEINGYKAFFRTTGGDIVFDIFAASFYLISRYEEYLPHEKDEYGRYAHTGSLAFKENFLQLPLVNIWLHDFKHVLKRYFPSVVFRNQRFRFIPTYDIDVAFSYLNKGLIRSAGGLLKSLFKGEISAVKERIKVWQGKQEDPYDVYEWLIALHLKYGLKPYYFFLIAKEQKGFDRNIEPTRDDMQELIQYHAQGYHVGLHPSWQSGDDDQLLREELELMEYITNRKTDCSRQHYIRFSLPLTYRKLIASGIEKEFSMGYGGINGFRASVASTFHWYDLAAEEKTSLIIYPFCFMDANAYYEQGYTPQQAYAELKTYHDNVKKVNGTLITIWHNHFFSNTRGFEGWKEVYEVFLNEVVYWDL
jgi:hypothetical protein